MECSLRRSILEIPIEILCKICRYLLLEDLVSVSNVCKRFRSVALIISKTFLTNKCLELFVIEHSKGHQTLNIMNCEDDIPDVVWVECVTRFQSLQSLRIINTKLSYTAAIDILVGLPQLQELTLFISEPFYMLNYASASILKTLRESNRLQLRTLRICINNTPCKYCFLHLLLLHLPNLQYLHIHLLNYPYVCESYYLSQVQDIISDYKLNLNKLDSFILTEENYDDKANIVNDFALLKSIVNERNREVPMNDYWIAPEILERFAVQMKKDREYFSTILCNNLNSENLIYCELMKYAIVEEFSEVKFISYNDINFEEEDLENFMKIGINKLEHLCLNITNLASDDLINERITTLFRTCLHIRELNLINSHIGICYHVFNGISNLTGLQRLALPACTEIAGCCLSNHSLTRNKVISDYSTNSILLLTSIAEKCIQLSELEIHGCKLCKSHENSKLCWDSFLSGVSKMSSLTALTLMNISEIGKAHFLKEIAINCLNIKCLQLHILGEDFSYVESLCHFLMEAPNLRNFRIGHRDLDLSNSLLWHALSEAKQLQKIRVLSNTKAIMHSKDVVKVLKNLTSLSVLHIHAPVKINKYKRILSWLSKRKERNESVVDLNRYSYKWIDNAIYLYSFVYDIFSLNTNEWPKECRQCFVFSDISYPKGEFLSNC